MKDIIISLETAKAAKGKLFKLYSEYSYWEGKLTSQTPGYPLENGETSQGNYYNFDRFYAPTQSLLAKWLRELHNKHVQITAEYYKDGINWNYQILWPDPLNNYDYKGGTGMCGDNNEYPTYEEALEAGLYYTLKNLI